MRILSVADLHGSLKRLALIRDRIATLKPDVLVAHPPPYGILDEVLGRFHTGSNSICL